MKKYLSYIILGVVCFGAGWLTKPSEKEVVTKFDEKMVENVKRDQIIVTERKPDGTVIRRREIKDRSEIKSQTELKQTVTVAKPQWSVGAYRDFLKPGYSLTVDRRIIGNVFVGVYGQLSETGDTGAGVGLRIEF